MVMFLFMLAIIVGAIGYYWYQKQGATENRYRKRIKKIAPTVAEKAEKSADSDSVLGIKKPIFNTSNSDPLIEQDEKPDQGASNTSASNVTATPIVLYLMAPETSVFTGYELLQAILSSGLRFGKHQIFHRHEHKDGRGEVLFHCASAQKPGIFDPSNMGNFSTRGLCLFFTIDNDTDPLATFDLMLDTLDQLVDDLGGAVYDDRHQLFTKDIMVKYRQRIRGVETMNTTADMFAEIE